MQKECKSPDKTMLIIEMDKQQLRDKIVQLEIEVKSLREIVINLEEKMSTINAVECELDETDRMSLTVGTMHNRQLEQENADLMERTTTLTKENQCFKKETKQLEEEREHFESIINIFQQTGMESDKALLSRILKGCKTHEKTLSILEKERQRLRHTIVELENEVEDLNEEILDLTENESTIEAAKCANNTAEKMSLTYETIHNRRLEKKNAVLKKTMKTLTNENENCKIENKKLQKKREYVKRIIKIFQETRIESDTALLRKHFTLRVNHILNICIHIDEWITIATALKHGITLDRSTAFAQQGIYRIPFVTSCCLL
ncbi:calcium-binding and coiled-coil domain-containing protein 2-like [Mya arenaria]|uniref:calcium-binding and coiled-coil domain-containing protein 2-like n=1 Tax=Mya arenaria TaxID=6604 RepID=UPI0022E6C15A|nr:calcium-binding and coiled-coil domain-containing protein 2-like [Mya arenaria]